MAIKGQRVKTCDGGIVLYLDYINVNILVVTLQESLQGVTIEGNWVKGTSSALLLKTACEFTMISK